MDNLHYLFVYTLVPEETKFFLIPDEKENDILKETLKVLHGVTIGYDTLNQKQKEALETFNSFEGSSDGINKLKQFELIAEDGAYQNLINTPVKGVYHFTFCL